MKLQFKFKEKARPSARRRLAAELVDHGAKAVRPLFPGEKDPELGALFLVDCATKRDVRDLLRLLDTSDDVDFAEEEVSRRLVR